MATFYVEQEGAEFYKEFDILDGDKNAIIIFDPDPIYDLDAQVASEMAKGFNDRKINATVASVSIAESISLRDYDLVVLIANTYNWRPDRMISKYIAKSKYLLHKKVAALTLGAGSTKSASRKLTSLIDEQGAELIASEMLWLLKPNDETDPDAPNVAKAKEKAYEWSLFLAQSL